MRYLHPFPVSPFFLFLFKPPPLIRLPLSFFLSSHHLIVILPYHRGFGHTYLRIDVDSTQLSTPFSECPLTRLIISVFPPCVLRQVFQMANKGQQRPTNKQQPT